MTWDTSTGSSADASGSLSGRADGTVPLEAECVMELMLHPRAGGTVEPKDLSPASTR